MVVGRSKPAFGEVRLRAGAGRYKGRKRQIDPPAITALAAEGLGPTAIAERLGINRASVAPGERARL
jgi:hypothetical protein